MGRAVIGLVLIALSLIVFPIVLTGAASILAWSATTGNVTATVSDFTGLPTLVAIAPLLIFIGLLVSGGWLTISGFRSQAGGGGRRSKAGPLH